MKVKVTAKKFGVYKEGDELEMHESTAKAVAKHGIVELLDDDKESDKKSKKK